MVLCAIVCGYSSIGVEGQDGVLRCFWGSGGVGGYGYGWLVWLPRGFALEYNYSECIQVRSGKFVAN